MGHQGEEGSGDDWGRATDEDLVLSETLNIKASSNCIRYAI